MKAIVELTAEEYEAYHKQYNELCHKIEGLTSTDMFSTLSRTFGYGHYVFSGRIADKLVRALGRVPTPNEIIMIVDSGYSHFGASCTITGLNFNGRVNID